MKYCESIFENRRRPTRTVMVGSVAVGSAHPVRVQSMTTSNTRDVAATVEQIMRLADAGCEIARVTVQGIKEAEACEAIKSGLVQKGYTIPLVADIHFFPPAAMHVVDFVDKVRINPGNFVDKRASFRTIDYDDASYAAEIEKIQEKFVPLVEKCKRLKRAMRIGTNHGSLSDRIMNRYGDTPQGMIESAFEFARICREHHYHDFMFSMKSSNPQVMIQAYRLLAAEMYKLGWDYPLHLGVTEAGEGEDGRIKSAMGIGSLLLDGLGDTIRVSLTEDPWYEIDPCRRLAALASEKGGTHFFEEKHRSIEGPKKRVAVLPQDMPLHRDGTVWVNVPDFNEADLYKKLGCDGLLGQPKLKISSVDGVIAKEDSPKIQALADAGIGSPTVYGLQEAFELQKLKQMTLRFALNVGKEPSYAIRVKDEDDWDLLLNLNPAVIVFSATRNKLHQSRRFFAWLQDRRIHTPVILNFAYSCSQEDLILQASAEYGSLFCDGLGDGIWLEGPYGVDAIRTLSFNILQAARMRTFKTDFISCPSCGRTLFNLQDVTKRIHARTSHLPGVKIAIMGCIVNGPGEMADADFGYVGSKPGMIDLYVGKQCVEKDIDFAEADDRLVELIKRHGRWVEKETLIING